MSKQIEADIDDYCIKQYDDGYRSHLGASIIGHECSRHIWYGFRWCKQETFSGRQLRLFNRGHREEDRFVEWLRGIGFKVVQHTYNEEGTQKQIRINGVSGHFGGSTDGVGTPPYIDEPLVLEFKTSGTGAKFNEITKKGVKIAKPQHYAQMSTYGYKLGMRYGLYCCINKNDDSLHIEVVELDWKLAEQLEQKAFNIITTKKPPERIANSPAYSTCTYCTFRDICHSDEQVDKNCRSCQHSEAIDGGKWFCNVFQQEIPKDFIPVGCDQHLGVK